METLYGVSPEPLTLSEDRANKRLAVSNRFYEVVHDLARGGVVSSITYVNGSNKNILPHPMHACVDLADAGGFCDLNEQSPEFSSSADRDEVCLRFSGLLRNHEGKGAGVRYESEYRYRWGYVKVRKRFVFAESGLSVRRLAVHRYGLRAELDHWGYRPAPEAEPSADPFGFAVCQWGRARAGTHFDCAVESRFIPRYIVNAEAGREGLEWFVSSELSEWSCQVTGRPGCGSFSISPGPSAGAVWVDISPLSLPRGAARLSGSFEFNFCHGFPIIAARANRPFLHTTFQRHDWPTDKQVRKWAADGIRTAHFHHDGDSFSDGLFWRDGKYPPFGADDMAEYDRVIKACHDNGIRVATYFSNKEFHPSTEAYKKHSEEWGRKADDQGILLHNRHKNDEYGAQMCLRSGWLEYLEKYIDTVLSHHALDGVYFDWNVGLYCNNPLHGNAPAAHASPGAAPPIGAASLSPSGHWDMDELVQLMEWTRRRVGPQGLVIVHNTMVPSCAIENFADYVVAMEWGYGMLSKSVPMPDELPLEWSFMGARSRGVIGYGTILPNSPKNLERQMALLCLVTGVAPWTAGELTLDVFSPLKGTDLSGYRFLDWRSSPAVLDSPALVSAAYVKNGEALVLVVNRSGETQSATCRLDVSSLGLSASARCRMVSTTKSGRAARRLGGRPLKLTVPGDGMVLLEIR